MLSRPRGNSSPTHSDAFSQARRTTGIGWTCPRLVPAEVVGEYGQHGCLCRLRDNAAHDRPLLVDAFLHCGDPVDAAARRLTLRFMCELSAQPEQYPIDQASFRRLVYFATDYYGETGTVGLHSRRGPVKRTARRWRPLSGPRSTLTPRSMRCGAVCHAGVCHGTVTFPVPMAEVMGSIGGIDFASFASDLEVDLPDAGHLRSSSFSALLDWVGSQGRITWHLDARWDLDAALTEDPIIDWLGFGRTSGEAEWVSWRGRSRCSLWLPLGSGPRTCTRGARRLVPCCRRRPGGWACSGF